MNRIGSYIIVDDDHFSNVLCSMVIRNTLGEVEIEIFTNPEEALKFIQNKFSKKTDATILFLDINMPILTGWDFMKRFEMFEAAIKDQIFVYIQSSSVDERDKQKASVNKYIKGFILKPVDGKTILSLADG